MKIDISEIQEQEKDYLTIAISHDLDQTRNFLLSFINIRDDILGKRSLFKSSINSSLYDNTPMFLAMDLAGHFNKIEVIKLILDRNKIESENLLEEYNLYKKAIKIIKDQIEEKTMKHFETIDWASKEVRDKAILKLKPLFKKIQTLI